jgi:hypothetical protein
MDITLDASDLTPIAPRSVYELTSTLDSEKAAQTQTPLTKRKVKAYRRAKNKKALYIKRLFNRLARVYARFQNDRQLRYVPAYNPDRTEPRGLSSKTQTEWCLDFEAACEDGCRGNQLWQQACLSLLSEAGGRGKVNVSRRLKYEIIQSVGILLKTRRLELNQYLHRSKR